MKGTDDVDWSQHFRELYQQFLPLLVVVATVVMLVFMVIRQKEKRPGLSDPQYAGASHVSLLSVAEGAPFDPAFALASPLELALTPELTVVDPPMGSEHMGLTYNAQSFLANHHLGDDFNGIGGGNSDLGDPVFAIGEGLVLYAGWPSDGWGNVVVLLHERRDGSVFESFYGHLDTIGVHAGQQVLRGDRIGTVGSANGRYLAHLHFELRNYATLDPGVGYSRQALGRTSGELSLMKWRGRPEDQLGRPPVWSVGHEAAVHLRTVGEADFTVEPVEPVEPAP